MAKAKAKQKPKRTQEQARNLVKDALGKPTEPEQPKPGVDAAKAKAEADAAFAERWRSWSVIDIPVDRIVMENRYRGDEDLRLGDLEQSIRKFGLMSPVGVQDMGDGQYKLVAGGRRLMVIRDLMKQDAVKAVVFDPNLDDGPERQIRFLEMEVEENIQRHSPSLRRKVERFNEIQDLIKKTNRDTKKDEAGKPASPKAAASKKPEPKATEQLRDRAASIVDMSHETKRQAEAVFRAGQKDPDKFGDVAEKMDRGDIAVNAAYKQVVNELIQFDAEGIPLTTKKMKDAFMGRERFMSVLKALKGANTQVNEIANSPGGERVSFLPAEAIKAHTPTPVDGEDPISHYTSVDIANAIKAISSAMPHAQCPACAEESGELGKHSKKCKMCFGSGHVNKATWDGLVKAEDKSISKIVAMGKKIEKDKSS